MAHIVSSVYDFELTHLNYVQNYPGLYNTSIHFHKKAWSMLTLNRVVILNTMVGQINKCFSLALTVSWSYAIVLFNHSLI